jgi:hypothetical protein
MTGSTEAAKPAEHNTGESLDRWGPTALISYFNLLIFTLTGAGVFWLVATQTNISAVMAGILGAVLGASGANANMTTQFWVGGNIGTKATTRALTALASSPSGGAVAPQATTQTVNITPAADPNAPVAPPDTDLDVPEPPKP